MTSLAAKLAEKIAERKQEIEAWECAAEWADREGQTSAAAQACQAAMFAREVCRILEKSLASLQEKKSGTKAA